MSPATPKRRIDTAAGETASTSKTDRVSATGLDIVDPPQALVDWLRPLGIAAGEGKLVDLTLAGAKKEIYSAVLNELLASDHCDLVIPIAGSSAQFQPQIAVAPVVEADARGKIIAAFLAPHADKSLALLSDAGIAAFRTPESCADAISAWRN